MPDVLVACHACDTLHRKRPLLPRTSARCSRCGTFLYSVLPDSLERTLALTSASLVLLVMANLLPFMRFEMAGLVQPNNLASGVGELWRQGYGALAALVLLASILAPALRIAGLLYILLPLRAGRTPRGMVRVFKWVVQLRPWGMLDVFLLGVIVAIIKLSSLAEILLGPALWCFGALILTSAATAAAFDPDLVWSRVRVAEESR